MGLGRREARHETVAAARTAGVDPSIYWEYQPGQKVMTRDGYPGKVLAVHDGPFAGNEDYEVVLDHGLGGGTYTASLLQPFHSVESKVDVKTAADDYPELGTILEERPPLARSVTGSLVQAKDTQADFDRDAAACDTCNGSGEIPDDDHPNAGYSNDPDYPHKACPDCGGDGHKTAARDVNEERPSDTQRCAHVYCNKGAVPGASVCSHHMQVERNEQAWSKNAAYNEGDPDKYTSEHKCPECGSERALESANGVIKCEDCGHEESNAQDGYTKQAGRYNDFMNLHVRAPDHPKRVEERASQACPCPQCKAKLADPKSHTRTASAGMPTENGDERHLTLNGHGPYKVRYSSWQAEGDNGKPAKGFTKGRYDVETPDGDSRSFSHSPHGPGLTGARPYAADQAMNFIKDHARKSGKMASLLGDYDFLTTAAVDSDFRFHVTATFADVRNKAKRLRSQGGVNIISATAGTIAANVKGDHHVYETVLSRQPGKQAVAQWACGCKWAAYSWGRTGNYKRYEGRMCSHALALQFEAQSRGMFGKQIEEDQKAPQWLKPRTRVVVQYDRDSGKNDSRPAQPRKRDLQRTYSTVDSSVAPVTLLCMLGAAQGASYDDLSLALESAGINAEAFLIEGKDLPSSDQDAAKHRHKGDQTPCSRAGCGHPDGIHGDNGATCLSIGCDCKKYTTTATDSGQTKSNDEGGTGAQESDEEKQDKKEARRKKHHTHHRGHESGHHGGEFPMRGGWGYGFGYQPYYADYDGGSSGPDGDGDADDAGGGGDSGGGGATASKHTASAFLETMDPTYTEGNDVRQNPNSNGLWNATKPPNPNDNPASTGWAATGDPKEFSSANANDAAGRLGSLNVEAVFEGLPPVESGTGTMPGYDWEAGEKQMAPKPPTPPRPAKPPMRAPTPQRINPKPPAGTKPAPKVQTIKPAAPARPGLPAPRAPEPGAAPKPAAQPIKPAGPTSVKPATPTVGRAPAVDVVPEVGAKPFGGGAAAGGAALVGGEIGRQVARIPWWQKHVVDPLGSGLNDIDQNTGHAVTKAENAVAWAPTKIGEGAAWLDQHDPAHLIGHGVDAYVGASDAIGHASDKVGDAVGGAWDSVFGGGHKSAPKAAPKAAPKTDWGKDSGGGGDWGGPKAPVKGTPGHAEPKVDPHEHGAPQLQTAPAGAGGKTLTTPSGVAAPGTAPRNSPKGPEEPEKPKDKPKSEEGEKGGRPRFPKIPLPGLWNPDYYRESNSLISGHGIGTKGNLDAGLTESRTAMALLEAELHEEPEAALPTTDGADMTHDDDPDGDVEGMASQGSLDQQNVEDIVAQFQATAGARALESGSGGGQGSADEGDVAAAAKAFLQTEAMKTFSPGEQRQIIDEGKDVVAANLDRLKIEGTHYEALEAALASADDTDDDGDLWS